MIFPDVAEHLSYTPSRSHTSSSGGSERPLVALGGSPNAKDTPNVKKRHRRAKSGANKGSGGSGGADDGNDSDGYEFIIVSLENKQWHFEAPSTEVRAWGDMGQ